VISRYPNIGADYAFATTWSSSTARTAYLSMRSHGTMPVS
jgi:hypothetical protein